MAAAGIAAVDVVDKFRKFQMSIYSGVEDPVDQLNFQVTVVILLVCCTTITVNTYVLSPVECFTANQIGSHSGQRKFVNNFCWTEGTYAVPIEEFKINQQTEEQQQESLKLYEDYKIYYYQWVPFVLGLQSLMFYLPRVLWGMLSYRQSGTDVGHIVRSAIEAVKQDDDKRKRMVRHVCERLMQLLSHAGDDEYNPKSSMKHRVRKSVHARLLQIFSDLQCRSSSWLMITYVCIKISYICNAFLQLYLMVKFLGFSSSEFGFGLTLLRYLLSGMDWRDTRLFPRVGSCPVLYKTASGTELVFAQCTLPINMINEKMYIFLWFWIIFVASVTTVSLPLWLMNVLLTSNRLKFIDLYLKLAVDYQSIDKRTRRHFVEKFLKSDGVFLLRMVELNAGDVICAEIVGQLWDLHLIKVIGKSGLSRQKYFTFTEDPHVAGNANAPDGDDGNGGDDENDDKRLLNADVHASNAAEEGEDQDEDWKQVKRNENEPVRQRAASGSFHRQQSHPARFTSPSDVASSDPGVNDTNNNNNSYSTDDTTAITKLDKLSELDER